MSRRPIEGPGDLTPLERLYLRGLREYCASSPTVLKICAKGWAYLAILLISGALIAWFLLARELTTGAALVVGMIAGALIRDLHYFRQTVRFWPATEAVIDHKQLEALIGDPPANAEW